MKMNIILYPFNYDLTNKHQMLSANELFLLAQLRSRVMTKGTLETSYDLIDFWCDRKFSATPKTNKKMIKGLLERLKEMRLLTFEEHSNKFVTIKFINYEGGYDTVPLELLEKSNSPHEFQVLVFVLHYQDMNGHCEFSFKGLEHLTQVSDRTNENIVNALCVRGLLVKHRGKKIEGMGGVRKPNKYFVPNINKEERYGKGSKIKLDLQERPQIEETPQVDLTPMVEESSEIKESDRPLEEKIQPAPIGNEEPAHDPKGLFLKQQEENPTLGVVEEPKKKSAAELIAMQESPENNIVEKTKKEPQKQVLVSESTLEKFSWLERIQRKAETTKC
jgi:hypothetical protein